MLGPWKHLARVVAASLVAALPLILLRPELERGALSTLIALSGTYATALLAAFLAFGVLEEGEIAALARPLGRLIATPRRAAASRTR